LSLVLSEWLSNPIPDIQGLDGPNSNPILSTYSTPIRPTSKLFKSGTEHLFRLLRLAGLGEIRHQPARQPNGTFEQDRHPEKRVLP
jgi:hypothetical protein